MDTTIEKSPLHPNVAVPERIISLVGGSVLLINALTNRNLSLAKALTAAYLIFRGSTGNCPVYRLLGKDDVDYRAPNVNIKTSISIDRPRHSVYATWRTLENLPLFMQGLKRVEEINGTVSSWHLHMPVLGTIKWTSEILREEPGEFLSWHSISASGIENTGKIEFKDAGKFGTAVHLVISYHAPLGAVGEKMARLLNPLLKTRIRKMLKHFKHYVETQR